MSRSTVPGDPYLLAPPPSLRDPNRSDRLLTVMSSVADKYAACLLLPGLRRSRSRPLPCPRSATLNLTVLARRDVACDTKEVTLVASGGGPLPAWQPGSHVEVRLPSGRVRPYSLCGDPADKTAYRIAVRRIPAGRGGSVEVHETLLPGVELAATGPVNAFPFAGESSVLFIAGGIGITPLLPMAREAARRGLDWFLVQTGRDCSSLPLTRETTALDPDGSHTVQHTMEYDGVPDPVQLLAYAPHPDAAVYCCGPPPLLTSIRDALALSPPPRRALHAQRFTPPPRADGAPFVLQLADGTNLSVASDRTMLDVLLETRPNHPYACREGFCGTCLVRVRHGQPVHHDRRLTPSERATGALLPCVSRAVRGSSLTIDA